MVPRVLPELLPKARIEHKFRLQSDFMKYGKNG